MSENQVNIKLEDEEVQYIYDDAQYIFDSSSISGSEELNNIILANGTNAFLIDGQYYVPAETRTIILQDDQDYNQYVINDNEDGITSNDNDSSNLENSLNAPKVVHYIEDEHCYETDESQIVYYTDVDNAGLINETEEDAKMIYPDFKRIKLQGQIVTLDQIFENSDEVNTLTDCNKNEEYQYLVLNNGEEQLDQNSDLSNDTIMERAQANSVQLFDHQNLDLSRITGKNLLTGQTVTLHNYMEKLQKKINMTGCDFTKASSTITKDPNFPSIKRNDDELPKNSSSKPMLKHLLNKKITLGKTMTGQTLIGKIIHVEKKNEEINDGESSGNVARLDEVDSLPTDINVDDFSSKVSLELEACAKVPEKKIEEIENIEENIVVAVDEKNSKVLIKEHYIMKPTFEYVSKTLGHLMEMNSIGAKLRSKNLIVKLIEKCHNSTKNKKLNISYLYGFMYVSHVESIDGKDVEKWAFMLDKDTKDVLLRQDNKLDDGDAPKLGLSKFFETMKITLVIIRSKGGICSTRVSLNSWQEHKCVICNKQLKNTNRLKAHLTTVHSMFGDTFDCEVCHDKFTDHVAFSRHKQKHVDEGELFACSVCGKTFAQALQLNVHMNGHDTARWVLQCTTCGRRCSNVSSLKKHLLTHTGIKPFGCTLCPKTFLNQGDLNYHLRIHDPAKFYTCEVCHRAFSRFSNLQRHSEIHVAAGATYDCNICGCTYNYISTLTRHIVQNHISPT